MFPTPMQNVPLLSQYSRLTLVYAQQEVTLFVDVASLGNQNVLTSWTWQMMVCRVSDIIHTNFDLLTWY